MTTRREITERVAEWTGLITFSILAGMTIVGVLLLMGEMP